MIRHRKMSWPVIPAAVIVLIAAIFIAPAESVAGSVALWQLTDGSLRTAGDFSSTDQGSLINGYTAEAVAVSDNGPIRQGIFRVTLSCFSPARPMTGQVPGTWYLRGNWELVEMQEGQEATIPRGSGTVIAGRIHSELPFNPFDNSSDFSAEMELPLKLVGKHWAKGKGVFQGNRLLTGEIEIEFERWQPITE